MGGGLKETAVLVLISIILCLSLAMTIFAYIRGNIAYIGTLVGVVGFTILLIMGLKERYVK